MSRHALVNPDISFSGLRSTFLTVWFLNAYLLFLFVCLDANSRKTDNKWIAIMLYTVEYIRESFSKNGNYSFSYFC